MQNTYIRVKQLFFWLGLKTEVKKFIVACDICQLCKSETVAYSGLLQPLPIPDQAWKSLSMDFIEGLPKLEGKDNILMVVDRLTKCAHFIGSHPPLQPKMWLEFFWIKW